MNPGRRFGTKAKALALPVAAALAGLLAPAKGAHAQRHHQHRQHRVEPAVASTNATIARAAPAYAPTFTPAPAQPSSAAFAPHPREEHRAVVEATASRRAQPEAAARPASTTRFPCPPAAALVAAPSRETAPPRTEIARAEPERSEPPRAVEPPRQRGRSGTPARPSAAVSAVTTPAPTARAARCAVEHTPLLVDLREPARAFATQLTVATHGDDVAVLVSLARPGRGREGLTYPASRLLRWPARERADRTGRTNPTERVSVLDAPGFEPDASFALGADGGALVIAPARIDVRAGRDGVFPPLRVQRIDARGSAVGAAVTLDDSAGLHVDAAPVALDDGGYLALLGRVGGSDDAGAIEAGAGRPGDPARVTLWLQRFDAQGRPAGERVQVTDAQSDDALGRYRAGLFVRGSAVRVAFAASSGPAPGVWLQRFELDAGSLRAQGRPVRLGARAAWGATFSADGESVLFRTTSSDGGPTRVSVVDVPAGPGDRVAAPRALGAGWDPSFALVRGTLLWSNAELPGGTDEEPLRALLAAVRPEEPLRVLLPAPALETAAASPARGARAGSPAGADFDPLSLLDAELQPTPSGAVLAWLHPATPEQGDQPGPRRVSLARVRCE